MEGSLKQGGMDDDRCLQGFQIVQMQDEQKALKHLMLMSEPDCKVEFSLDL